MISTHNPRRELRQLALATAVAAALPSCGGEAVVTPDSPFVVTLSAPLAIVTGVRDVDQSGNPRVTCIFQVRVAASGGRSGSYVHLLGGPVVWRLTATGEEKRETLDPSSPFGVEIVSSGETITAGPVLSWKGPFTAAFEISWYKPPTLVDRDQGGSGTFVLTCL